jgi:hypothetical protein
MEEKKIWIFKTINVNDVTLVNIVEITKVAGDKKLQPIQRITQMIAILMSILALVRGYTVTILLVAGQISNDIVWKEHRRSLIGVPFHAVPVELTPEGKRYLYYRFTKEKSTKDIIGIMGIEKDDQMKLYRECVKRYGLLDEFTRGVIAVKMQKNWFRDYFDWEDPEGC